MDATEKKMFRKSVIGGFSKEDVNNYIVEISEKHATEIKELKEKCSAAEEKNRELSEELSGIAAKLSELSRDSAELSELKEKHAELSSAYEAKSSEASAASAKNSELEARVGSLSSIEKEYVARKTELADIEISARGRANSIISDAEAAAAAIRRELERELAEKRRRFDAERAALYAEAGDDVSGLTKLLSALRGELENMDVRLLRMTDTVRTSATALSDAVVSAEDKIGSITTKLHAACDGEEE